MLPVQMVLYEDAERRENLRHFNIARRIRRNDSDPFALEDDAFVKIFRLTKDMVHLLINTLFAPLANSNHINAITPQMKIFTALYFYASGSYQSRIGDSFNLNMSQQSVSRCIDDVSSLIVQYFIHDWIKFPTTAREKAITKQLFMAKGRFPGCIGCIDCTHVAMLAPSNEEHNYVNRKGFHSKNVQIICDANLKILAINARHTGSTHDAAIWNASVINEHLATCYREGGINTWLVGDSGYPQLPWLMTPIQNPIHIAQENYNERLRATRNSIERCNGVLKGRFRCILGERVLRYSPEKVGRIVNACAVLHNMCIEARLDAVADAHAFVEDDNNPPIIVNFPDVHFVADGRNSRNNLINTYFN